MREFKFRAWDDVAEKMWYSDSGSDELWTIVDDSISEVIGNIFENPGFIKNMSKSEAI